MPAYDTVSFAPPAPVAGVSIRSAANGPSVADVRMLIDTGADVSLLPRATVAPLLESAETGDEYELEGFDGSRSLAPAVCLELLLLGRIFRGQFLLVDQDYGILGRNILNAIPLVLDGPNSRWDESPSD